MRGEVFLTTVSLVLLITMAGLWLLKKAHNEVPQKPPVYQNATGAKK